MSLASHVRRIREEIGLTQTELADAAGLRQATISQIETGRRTPALSTVFKLASALGVSAGELLQESGPAGGCDHPAGPEPSSLHRRNDDLSEF